MTDEEILKMLADRDEQALVLLQRKYGAYCQSIALRLLGNAQEAEEVVNDSWMQIWERAPEIAPEKFGMYLARTVRNTALHCIAFRSAQKRSWIRIQLDELAECIPDRLMDCDAERIALKDALTAFLRGLKPEYRRIFLGRYWYGATVEELAEEFRCTKNRVCVILHRCRRQLRNHLEKEDIGL